jgi:hypothetical protein
MDISPDFSFKPLSALENPTLQPFPEVASPLGPLAGLAGKWSGRGFNVIWRPDSTPDSDHFLELNVTSEQLEFTAISGQIPNRGRFRCTGSLVQSAAGSAGVMSVWVKSLPLYSRGSPVALARA